MSQGINSQFLIKVFRNTIRIHIVEESCNFVLNTHSGYHTTDRVSNGDFLFSQGPINLSCQQESHMFHGKIRKPSDILLAT
jgi:hypothetical protein